MIEKGEEMKEKIYRFIEREHNGVYEYTITDAIRRSKNSVTAKWLDYFFACFTDYSVDNQSSYEKETFTCN